MKALMVRQSRPVGKQTPFETGPYPRQPQQAKSGAKIALCSKSGHSPAAMTHMPQLFEIQIILLAAGGTPGGHETAMIFA
jgi:hypothetical protein